MSTATIEHAAYVIGFLDIAALAGLVLQHDIRHNWRAICRALNMER